MLFVGRDDRSACLRGLSGEDGIDIEAATSRFSSRSGRMTFDRTLLSRRRSRGISAERQALAFKLFIELPPKFFFFLCYWPALEQLESRQESVSGVPSPLEVPAH
jgi:hypothetical protein